MTGPHRARHPARTLLVLVLVVLGLAVAADRIGVVIAQSAAADALQRSQHLAQRPSVSIDGFPFLTQLAAGDFDHIVVTANNVTVGQGADSLRLEHVRVTLRQVHVSRDFSSGHAAVTEATATVRYADLSSTLGVAVTYAGDAQVKASQSVTILGVTASGTATARPELVGSNLEFADPQVSLGGAAVPAALTAAFEKAFAISIPLTGLPFGARVVAVSAGAGGLTVSLVADGVSFAR